MRVVVFGAAGRTGRAVVTQALERGHTVTAFVRQADAFDAPAEVRVVEGDAREADPVEGALREAGGVISVLALMAPEREPEHSDATRVVVAAAERVGVPRVVVAANNDVLGDREVTGEFAAHAREHRRNRATLQASGLDWTILAAPWVTDEPVAGRYDAVANARGQGRKISATDLATATLDALERDDWIGHIVGVSAA